MPRQEEYDVQPFLDQMAGMGIKDFHRILEERRQETGVEVGLPPEDIANRCAYLVTHPPSAAEGDSFGPLPSDEAKTLLAWLMFKRPGHGLFNEPLAILARSKERAVDFLKHVRWLSYEPLAMAYEKTTGGGPDFPRLRKRVFIRDTNETFEIKGASRCQVYSHNSQFRCIILFQEERTSIPQIVGPFVKAYVKFCI